MSHQSCINAGYPSAPDNITVSDVSATTISLQWIHPLNESVDIFTVRCTPHAIIQTTPTTSVELRNLEECTNYTCSVAAANIFGLGPSSSLETVQTNTAGKSFLRRVVVGVDMRVSII